MVQTGSMLRLVFFLIPARASLQASGPPRSISQSCRERSHFGCIEAQHRRRSAVVGEEAIVWARAGVGQLYGGTEAPLRRGSVADHRGEGRQARKPHKPVSWMRIRRRFIIKWPPAGLVGEALKPGMAVQKVLHRRPGLPQLGPLRPALRRVWPPVSHAPEAASSALSLLLAYSLKHSYA